MVRQSKVVPFRNQAKRFEKWSNGLANGMKAAQACWTARKLVKRFTEAYKQDSLTSQTQPVWIAFSITNSVLARNCKLSGAKV